MTASVPAKFEVTAFFVADHAEAVNGKVYVNGGFWNRLNFVEYPALVPTMALVAVVSVPYHEYQKDHDATIGMVDADGQELPLKVEGKFRVGASSNLRPGEPTLMPVAFVVNGMKVDRPGDYSFTFSIGGEELARYGIRAVHVAAPMRFEIDDPS